LLGFASRRLAAGTDLGTPRDKIGSTIGRLDPDTLVAVDRALATFLGIA
jgi:hypothetical protein